MRIYLSFIFSLLSLVVFAQKADSLNQSGGSFEIRKRDHVYFVSNRLCDDNKYDVFKVTPTDKEPPVIIVRGKLKVDGLPKIKKAKIHVFNASTDDMVGVFNTNSFTGNYLLVLAPSVKYIFKVDIDGYSTLTEEVEVPMKIDYEVCYQEMNIKPNGKKAKISVNSFFTDENEKVFYMKAMVDTTRHLSNMYQFGQGQKKKEEKKGVEEVSTVDELVKKQIDLEKKKPIDALNYFKLGKYESALQIYSLLMKNDPGDPFVNYYYGVCNFKLGKSKTKAISALQLASAYKEVPYDVFLYLGQACHYSYLFENAIAALQEYKKRAKPLEISTNNIAGLIKNCNSGMELINNKISIEIMKREEIKEKEYLSFYDPDAVTAIQYKTDFFKSPADKLKPVKQLITNFHQREYIHVSYGPNQLNKSDLYVNVPLPNGKPGPSKTMGPEINTPDEENYPYLSKNGLTLYFSSKGHNSMGGYDIFKCIRPDTLTEWSKPINLGYPINSTYDDIMYLPDTAERFAGMCSNRKNGQFEYIHMKLPNKANSYSVVKGQFLTSDSLGFRDAYISVYDVSTGELAGIYKTNHETGMYLMILASGRKYELVIEYEGLPEFRSTFDIPEKKGEFEMKQIIKVKKDAEKDAFKIKNYLTEFEAERVAFEKGAGAAKENGVEEKPKPDPTVKRTPEEMKLDREDLTRAKTFYDQSNFKEASAIFEKVSARTEIDPLSNYYYGVSLYQSHMDKTFCIPVLYSIQKEKNMPTDLFLYLARANYYSYRFKTAIAYYNKFIAVGSPDENLKKNLDAELECCRNSIKLVNNPMVLEVFEKKHVERSGLQGALSHIESGARVLTLTEDLASEVDKKQSYKCLFYITPDKSKLIYSSYGDDQNGSKDLYIRKKLSTGKWSPQPEKLTSLSTDADEEYPSFSKDGKSIYFSSKGLGGMGGYDIFKSTWDEKLQVWGAPVNMGSPVNSPYDDLFFLE